MVMQATILVVDDAIMIHRIITQILKPGGYKVLKAVNGQEGYEMAKKFKPNVIIMDAEMPVMCGVESTRLIKSDPETSNIPVVFFTSLASEEQIAECKEAGAHSFLNKPVSKEAILESVNSLTA